MSQNPPTEFGGMSVHGTFETCRPDLSMSVHRGRSEVTGEQSERRDWRFRISSSGANDRFAPTAAIPASSVFGNDRARRCPFPGEDRKSPVLCQSDAIDPTETSSLIASENGGCHFPLVDWSQKVLVLAIAHLSPSACAIVLAMQPQAYISKISGTGRGLLVERGTRVLVPFALRRQTRRSTSK
jgi:hypothetical protein